MDTPKHSEPLIIGEDIPWGIIKGEFYRVTQFTPFARFEADKIKNAVSFLPYGSLIYGSLTLESPKLPQKALMPVIHKDDFRLLWEVFKRRGVSDKEEVIVSYVPFHQRGLLKYLSATKACLHIFIFPKGHLEEACDVNFSPPDPSAWQKPIAEWHPKYWRP